LHGPLGDLRDLTLEADEIGELVDAFLAYDGRIHVGDQQAFEAMLLRLDEHIHVRETIQRPADRLEIAGHLEVDGIPFIDPIRKRGFGVDLPQRSQRAVDQPVIKPSGCYQRGNGHKGRQTSGCTHCGTDG
jgi:hypothetical protein